MHDMLLRARRRAGRLLREIVPYNSRFRPTGIHPTSKELAHQIGSGVFYQEIYPAYTSTLDIPPALYEAGPSYNKFPHREEVPPAFTLEVLNGRLYADNFNSEAVISADNKLIGDVSFQYARGKWQLTQPADNNIFQQRFFLPPIHVKGTVCSLLSGGGAALGNYYHWLVDSLPRLHLIREAGLLDSIDYFLVYNRNLRFMLETLAPLGIGPERIIDVTTHRHLQADRLLLSSPVRGKGVHTPDWAFQFLRDTYLPATCTREFNPYIYISRRDAPGRRVQPAAEVEAMLAQEFGFATYVLSELSFAEKVALFSQAKAVISPIGAGLSNIIFSPRAAPLLELLPSSFALGDYCEVCARLGKHYDWLVCESPEQADNHNDASREDLTVDLTTLRERVSLLLSHVKSSSQQRELELEA
ncbi:glycosyltransferase family 61 protein [Hymenobacter cellulosilyticus]|uniref:Glycosyltransferase family 61 protein n=1 Tax=Hymenobacter cellulosilyticus TaxID=2932248 RepID=A0A8T9PZ59_9BACT|nr:glycosyltransferase family 61 protein [Hymenobacter cellulosilyticus]UOQ70025.1 glycosyltransferase family 61 protein [Hymenobacter cellulosilyticus]